MPSASSIGIYGAGQLGAFLCLAARQLGLRTTVLAGSEDEPAVAIADQAIIAASTDIAATRELLNASDVVTFEREDINPEVLQVLASHAQAGGVVPHPDVIALIQDKARQKKWLVDNNIPTAKFVLCSGGEAFADLAAQVGMPFIQKACKGGFDGRGVQKVSPADPRQLWPGDSIAEELVNYEREISVLVARSRQGETACYPVVDVEADPAAHQLNLASSPSTLSADTCKKAEQLGCEVVALLNGVGLFAIEMFVTREQNILVNEISPRVHNTGHLTIEANYTSQFEQHIRAVCGFDLGEVKQQKPAAMKNIVHQENMQFDTTKGFECTQLDANSFAHWYGKKQPKPQRKMGHLTVLAATVVEARAQVELKYDELTKAQERVA